MDDVTLREQKRYYRERAAEYDNSLPGHDDATADAQAWEFLALPQIIARLARCDLALELACGTGIWTPHVLQVARAILAVDASPEMLALHRAKVADARVRYQVANLFAWEAEQPVDLAFAAFWFSHVPAERLAPLLAMLRRAVRPGGQLCVIDEPDSSPARPPAADLARQDAARETRTLRDGRRFQIVKIYRPPEQLKVRCAEAGFTQATCIRGTYFFGLITQ
jgi:demethylmenaquinone methyltransferase/2-methoxy-6-polyprenyl-1,4-benzoquinol methylase